MADIFEYRKGREVALVFNERNVGRLRKEHIRVQYWVGDGGGQSNPKLTLSCLHPDKPNSRDEYKLYFEMTKRVRVRATNLGASDDGRQKGAKTGWMVPIEPVWVEAYRILDEAIMDAIVNTGPISVEKPSGKRRANNSIIFEKVTQKHAFQWVLCDQAASERMVDEVCNRLGLPDAPDSWTAAQSAEFRAAIAERLRGPRKPNQDRSDEKKYKEACKPWVKPSVRVGTGENADLPPRVVMNLKAFKNGESQKRNDGSAMPATVAIRHNLVDGTTDTNVPSEQVVSDLGFDPAGVRFENKEAFTFEMQNWSSVQHVWVNGTGINITRQLERMEYYLIDDSSTVDEYVIPKHEDDVDLRTAVKAKTDCAPAKTETSNAAAGVPEPVVPKVEVKADELVPQPELQVDAAPEVKPEAPAGAIDAKPKAKEASKKSSAKARQSAKKESDSEEEDEEEEEEEADESESEEEKKPQPGKKGRR